MVGLGIYLPTFKAPTILALLSQARYQNNIAEMGHISSPKYVFKKYLKHIVSKGLGPNL